MLFVDLLKQKDGKTAPEFEKLFSNIIQNQTHSGDLLLVRLNGSYRPSVRENASLNLNPYVTGPFEMGLSESTHYEFIHQYRTTFLFEDTYASYLKLIKYSPERAQEIEDITRKETLWLQIEMLIYLKIWEMDIFIKKMYQLTRLSHGEEYDWHFKITESNRDQEATGTRQEIIRKKVRDRLKEEYPNIYQLIKNAYQTQVRNAIAHSKYSVRDRYIQLYNYIKQDQSAQLKSIDFLDWTDKFHDTIVIYNQLIGFMNKVNEYYSKIAKDGSLKVEVRINRTDLVARTEKRLIKYRPEFNDWHGVP